MTTPWSALAAAKKCMTKFVKRFPSDKTYEGLVLAYERNDETNVYRSAVTLCEVCGSLALTEMEKTVWLTQAQMTELFGVDRTVITRHVNKVFKEHELEKESNVQKRHIANADRPVQFYSLDVIISIGYRVKSQRGHRNCECL